MKTPSSVRSVRLHESQWDRLAKAAEGADMTVNSAVSKAVDEWIGTLPPDRKTITVRMPEDLVESVEQFALSVPCDRTTAINWLLTRGLAAHDNRSKSYAPRSDTWDPRFAAKPRGKK